jgi:hypothetical protein
LGQGDQDNPIPSFAAHVDRPAFPCRIDAAERRVKEVLRGADCFPARRFRTRKDHAVSIGQAPLDTFEMEEVAGHIDALPTEVTGSSAVGFPHFSAGYSGSNFPQKAPARQARHRFPLQIRDPSLRGSFACLELECEVSQAAERWANTFV